MKFRLCALLFLLTLVFPNHNSVAIGQTFRGSLSGTVVDPSGASLSDAAVEARNISTGLLRKTTTSDVGEFAIPDLPLGEYAITVSHPGFDTFKVDRVVVEVGKATGVRIPMRIAGQSQTVEVTASAVTLDTETATENQVIPNRAVQDVPLNGRDFTQLVNLAAGVNG